MRDLGSTRQDGGENLFYLGAGPLGAIVLGLALVPLREFTTASNLAFAFLALTLVVAEFGGTWATLATAVTSALSLNFFLTRPYLRLTIHDRHDIIAVVGLAACGLIVASLSSLRRQRIAELTASRAHHDLLRSVLAEWAAMVPTQPQLERILRAAATVLPLAAATLRDPRGLRVASTEAADAQRAVPEATLADDALAPSPGFGRRLPDSELPLPREGTRIALVAGTRPLGWLDVWGDGRPASAESRRALADVAHVLAILLAATSPPRRT